MTTLRPSEILSALLDVSHAPTSTAAREVMRQADIAFDPESLREAVRLLKEAAL